MSTPQTKPNLPLNKVFANKFKMYIPKVPIIGTMFDQYSLNALELTIKGGVVPGISVDSVDLPVLGHKPLKVTGAGYKMDDINIKFLIDGDFTNYYLLWSWLNSIYDVENAQSPVRNEGDNPYVDIAVSALDNYNDEIIQFRYKGAFITSIGNVEVDYENPDRLETTATFAYDTLSLVKN